MRVILPGTSLLLAALACQSPPHSAPTASDAARATGQAPDSNSSAVKATEPIAITVAVGGVT